LKLSVIILNYNVRYFLELCLKSVEAAIQNIDAEIIVVDNNSEDESCKMVKDLFPKVNLIENKENSGFSKGNNIGVLQAKGEYLCILNPDTVVAEDTFEKILEFADGKEKLGIVGCKLINGNGLFLPESKRNVPTVNVALKKILGFPKAYYANQLSQIENGKVDVLVGAFMVLKKDVYNEVNGFDEDYFMYGEDIDLSYKILKAGYNNYYCAEVTVIHYKGESSLKDRFYARRFFGAMQIFYKKHFKQNVLFDMFVWLGIKLAYMFRGTSQITKKKVSEYVFISDKSNEKLASALSENLILKHDLELESVKSNSEIIFDANVLTCKEIIKTIAQNDIKKQITYKIMPKKSLFLIGSDNGFRQGEIILLK